MRSVWNSMRTRKQNYLRWNKLFCEWAARIRLRNTEKTERTTNGLMFFFFFCFSESHIALLRFVRKIPPSTSPHDHVHSIIFLTIAAHAIIKTNRASCWWGLEKLPAHKTMKILQRAVWKTISKTHRIMHLDILFDMNTLSTENCSQSGRTKPSYGNNSDFT